MLLLFWKALGLSSGLPVSLKWYHSSPCPPRCLVTGEFGISVVNPYLDYSSVECGFASIPDLCNCSDIYAGDIIIGTQNSGLMKVGWGLVAGARSVKHPVNLTDNVGTFTMFSGLLSQSVTSIEANNDYLGVVTSSGFCYGKQGNTDFITYVTESGKDCYVCQNGVVYLAEGNRVLSKSSPIDFSDWPINYQVSDEINDIWVTEKDGINTLFVGTVSGIYIFENGQQFIYGYKNYNQIKAEVGTTFNHGHLFAVSGDTVDIINMRDKSLENSITYSGSMAIVVLENKRLYSK